MKNLLKKGENIILPTPCNSLISSVANEHGVEVRLINLLNDKGLSIDKERFEQLIDQKTKAIFMSNTLDIIGLGLGP